MDSKESRIAALIFDWDGTIADTRQAMYRSYRHAYRTHLGIDFPSNDYEFRQIIALRLPESSAKFAGEKAADVAGAYSWYYQSEGYTSVQCMPEMEEVLAALQQRGCRLAIATNKGRERAVKDGEHLNMLRYFDTLVAAEDTRERKPHPAPLLKAAEKLGIDPALCAYIGDYPGDVQAAKAAGMLSIAVRWGFFPESELRAQSPDYLLQQPQELLAIGGCSESATGR